MMTSYAMCCRMHNDAGHAVSSFACLFAALMADTLIGVSVFLPVILGIIIVRLFVVLVLPLVGVLLLKRREWTKMAG